MFCISYAAIITYMVGEREKETERQIGRQRQRERDREIQRESEIGRACPVVPCFALTILQLLQIGLV